MSPKTLKKPSLEQVLTKTFKNKQLLKTALTHPAYLPADQVAKFSDKFQRLEFLGDVILNYFIATELYKRFPDANEGLLSRMRSILVSKKLLSKIARSIRLKVHPHAKGPHDPGNDKILSDVFEALIAAIHFDRGQVSVDRFLIKCFRPYFDQKKLFAFDPNPKSALQEFVQKRSGILPSYSTLFDKKKSHFVSYVTIRQKRKTKGHGRTKQEAESSAAAVLLKKLKAMKKVVF